MKNQLRQLALEFLTRPNKADLSALDTARKLLQPLDVESSYGAIKKFLGISYLAGVNSSSKIEKGKKLNIDTLVLYLSASRNAGFDMCPKASEACRALCLVNSGRASMDKASGYSLKGIYVSRLIKSWLYRFNRPVFLKLLKHEIARAERKAKSAGRKFGARLNGTSDLNFHAIYAMFPGVQFYEYTKFENRPFNAPYNAYYTFSYSGENTAQCKTLIAQGVNVAVAVAPGVKDYLLANFPESVFDGDVSDARFTDTMTGALCLLSVKGNNYDPSSRFICTLDQSIALIQASINTDLLTANQEKA